MKPDGRGAVATRDAPLPQGPQKISHAPQATIMAIARIRSTMKRFCTPLPARTPRQLMTVRITTTVTAANFAGIAPCENARAYSANVTATAALPPALITSRLTQP